MKGNPKVRSHREGSGGRRAASRKCRAARDEPRRRDLLIEHLHKINDRYGHLSAAHSRRSRRR
jgi:formate dehydrogenase